VARLLDGYASARILHLLSSNWACFPVSTIAPMVGIMKRVVYTRLHRMLSARAVTDAVLLQRSKHACQFAARLWDAAYSGRLAATPCGL
jgi:hypothetical protein